MARKGFVGGNWKCNMDSAKIDTLLETFNAGEKANVDVVVAPPAVYLTGVKSKLRADWNVSAQNCGAQGNGAFTGEVSADMLTDVGIPYVILGHSERRAYYGDSDEIVAKKMEYALSKGLNVIACCGETLEEREAGKTMDVVQRQVAAFAKLIDASRVVIAYEPVWAIGTGKVATPEQAQQVHADLRAWLATTTSAEVAAGTRIIYGGSVTADSAPTLFSNGDVDGFLVGGASLKPDFLKIVAAAQ